MYHDPKDLPEKVPSDMFSKEDLQLLHKLARERSDALSTEEKTRIIRKDPED